MSRCITQEDSKIKIKSEDIPKVLKALKEETGEHFYSIKDAFDTFCFSFEEDEEDNIIDVNFEGECYYDQDVLFNTIAPWVEKNSYVSFYGEEGDHFRFFFNGKECVEEQAVISYPSENTTVSYGGVSRDEAFVIMMTILQESYAPLLNELKTEQVIFIISNIWDIWKSASKSSSDCSFKDFVEKFLKEGRF